MKNSDILLNNMKHYCSVSEKSEKEIRDKLRNKVDSIAINKIIYVLIEEDFINEQRMAISFANSKLRYNHWGKIKIKFELKNKGVSETDIEAGLNSIDSEEYCMEMKKCAQKWIETHKDNIDIINKYYRFMSSKGFEIELFKKFIAK